MSNSSNTTASNKNGSKSVVILGSIIIVLLLVIIVGGVFLFMSLNDKNNKPDEVVSGNLVVDSDNVGAIEDDLRAKVEEGMFETSMNVVWNFEDGSSASMDAFIANSVNNTKPIYFEVILADTSEVIYTSPVIPVGSQLKALTLDEVLPAGSYTAYCKYHLLNEDNTEFSNVAFTVTINILS